MYIVFLLFFFFFNDTATTEIYTLSLHDALPIYPRFLSYANARGGFAVVACTPATPTAKGRVERPISFVREDRKSTRLNSSHGYISYAVFCLKKKKKLTSTFLSRIAVKRSLPSNP